MEKQVKSKKRVADHGEVIIAEREEKAMLDLVKHETERIESTFLEPTCGNGNPLAEILRRRLAVVDQYWCLFISRFNQRFPNASLFSLNGFFSSPHLLNNTVENAPQQILPAQAGFPEPKYTQLEYGRLRALSVTRLILNCKPIPTLESRLLFPWI